MMTPSDHVRAGRGEVPAVVVAGSGETLTYRELDERSMRLARRLHAHGLRPGGHVAVLLENSPRWFEVFWAVMRSGLYLAPISWHLDASEAAEMIEHSGATALITSAALDDVVQSLGARRLADVTLRLAVDDDVAGFARYEDELAAHPARPLRHELQGEVMFYSSGTTGRPKTLEPPLSGAAFGERPNVLAALFQARWDFGTDTVFLCGAPMYHSAPLGFTAAVQRLGGTVVLMEEFDPKRALELIEEHEVTHALLLPHHIDQLVALDDETRVARDLSSLRVVVHGTGPCSVDAKTELIDWWGKIVHEYYVGCEGNAFTLVDSADWLAHKGTVGKLLSGRIHVLDDDGAERPAGETGQIWFETGVQFEYHNDPVSTAAAFNDRGWSTLGDLGHVDEDGWLYVTDRVAHIIDVGGSTVLPQAIEDALRAHPSVTDAAVVGADGTLRAVVHLSDDVVASDDVAGELRAIAGVDDVTFVDALPRLPTGKLLKRLLSSPAT